MARTYALSGGAISNANYSQAKAPLGFPLDPSGWTETLTDSGSRSQASAAVGTWYNPGGLSLAVPIGAWRLDYRTTSGALTTGLGMSLTLSTSNNGESDSALTQSVVTGANGGAGTTGRDKSLVLTSKTTYYLNVKTDYAGSPTIYSSLGNPPLIIRAVCAYL